MAEAAAGGASLHPSRVGPASRFRRALGVEGTPATLADEPVAEGWGWLPALCLLGALALGAAALAANASRAGAAAAVPAFYAAVVAAFGPAAARAMTPRVSRRERFGIVLLLTGFLFAVRVVRAPVAFIDHDEFLHWRTLTDILESGRLFGPNALLPVSPLYPGLELATAVVVQVAGLSVFGAALLVVAVARLVFVGALLLFFEHVTGSARAAGAAAIVFMGSSTFVFFDTHFSYESLAVAFLALALLGQTMVGGDEGPGARAVPILAVVLAALALTHHTTAFFAAALIGGYTLAETVRAPRRWRRLVPLWVGAALAVALPLGWSRLMGNPGSGYLGPVFEGGLRELGQLLTFTARRRLFVGDDGTVAPAWQRLLTFGSVFLVCAGLALGFLRAVALAGLPALWRRPARMWTGSWLLLLTGLTLLYPASILFRLTRSGWEIGNRLGPLTFYGVAAVIAVAVVCLWRRTERPVLSSAMAALGASVLLLGGIISSEGPRILVPARYEVSADSSSVGPLGIEAARWTRRRLGPGNLFATDRINRLLVSTYGGQDVATTLQDTRDTSLAITSERFGPSEIDLLRRTGVDYVMTDLRLTTSLPVVGVYFDGGAGDQGHRKPLLPAALMKFNGEPRVGRVFDNGYLAIFDMRTIDGRR